MARQKSEVTLAIEALVVENPDITAADALPKLAEAGYKGVKDYTFNNLKSKLQRGVIEPSVQKPAKAKAKASRPKVHTPEPVSVTVQEAFGLVRDDFGGSVEDAEAYVARLTEALGLVRQTLEVTADVG